MLEETGVVEKRSLIRVKDIADLSKREDLQKVAEVLVAKFGITTINLTPYEFQALGPKELTMPEECVVAARSLQIRAKDFLVPLRLEDRPKVAVV
jgi:hypothetical protein